MSNYQALCQMIEDPDWQ